MPLDIVYAQRMRDWILKLLIASILFVSVEGAAESVDDESFHQTQHSQSDNADNQWIPDSDRNDHEGTFDP